MRLLRCLLVLALLPAAGCVIDRTGSSGSYLLREQITDARERARDLQKDLTTERTRIDAMEENAAAARKRLADSGATLDSFLDELGAIRGEMMSLGDRLTDGDRMDEDTDLRLTTLEIRVAQLEKELGITPPPMLPAPAPAPVAPAPAAADPSEPVEEPAAEPPSAIVVEGSEAGADVVDTVEAGDDAAFAQAVELIRDNRWDRAGGVLQKYLRDNPDAPHAMEAQYLIGQCLFELGRFKNAITEFQKVIESEDNARKEGDAPDWAPKAMFMQGLAFQELGTKQDIEAAELFFEELVRLYPDSAEAERARRRIERLHEN